MVDQGLADSRARAKALIMAGRVLADGTPVAKAGGLLPAQTVLRVKEGQDFASRGGVKLSGALDDLGLDVRAWKCLDIGASTGGFTDCLLQRGAAGVTAVDVGYGLIHWRLRQDSRVRVLERTNARGLTPEMVDGPYDLAVIDVSFISLALVLPPVIRVLRPEALILALVKPQFEVGREKVGRGGVVRDPELQAEAVARVADKARELDLAVLSSTPARIKGPKGNQEHFLLMRLPGTG